MKYRIFLGGLCTCLLLAPIHFAADSESTPDEQILKDVGVDQDATALLGFFKNMSPSDEDTAKIKKLIEQLGDDEFDVREQATKQLKEKGPTAIPFLKTAAKSPDPEVARRADECSDAIRKRFSSTVVGAAARLLTKKRPDGTAAALLGILPSTEDEAVADEIRNALVKLAGKDGKAEPAIVAALTDKSPARRAAAGYALVRAGAEQEMPAVRKLLQDSEPIVRLHVGMALAGAREKEAVPALIELLDKLPMAQVAGVEEMLYRLAEEKQVPTLSGSDDAARKKYREAWSKWWTDNGEKVDFAKAEAPKLLGYTVIVLLDQNKVIELDADNKTRWEVAELQFPLDVQYLAGGRLLLAEQQGGRVTERTLDGKVVWEYKMTEPLVAQRFPNGHTFIAGRNSMIVLDAKGNEVMTRNMPQGDQVMRAQRLPNGEIAHVVQHLGGVGAGRTEYIHLDAAGKELHRFDVNVSTFGGRIQLLPNGHVLIPEMHMNRVAEYNNEGKVVWETKVEQPIMASRLPNGNTLVTSMTQKKAIELDRDGKQVWEYTNDTRVTRALRR